MPQGYAKTEMISRNQSTAKSIKRDAITTLKENAERALTPLPKAVQLGLELILLQTADSSLASTSCSADLGRCTATNWKVSEHADTQSLKLRKKMYYAMAFNCFMHLYLIKQIDRILNVTAEVQRYEPFGTVKFVFCCCFKVSTVQAICCRVSASDSAITD